MKKLILSLMFLTLTASAGLFNFEPSKASKALDATNSFILEETLITQQSQRNFNKKQAPPILEYSLERENLSERLKRWNSKNKISYIYLIEKGVGIVAYFPIRGKVSSVNSKLTTNQQFLYMDGVKEYGVGVVESPDMDGSYGSNGDGIFFFLTDGTYMEWNSTYLLSDRPIKLTVQPLMTMEMSKELGKKKGK